MTRSIAQTPSASLHCHPPAVQGARALHLASDDPDVPKSVMQGRGYEFGTAITSGMRRGSAGLWRSSAPRPVPILPARSAFLNCEVSVPEVDDSVTGLIRAWGDGDSRAGDQLFARVYDELRQIARRLCRRNAARGDQTLETTALVHEVYLRLAGAGTLSVQDRGHFFAVAVRATRQIVSNHARDAVALKRGGAAIVETLDGERADRIGVMPDDPNDRIVALDEALQQLERLHPRPCRVVECRYFGGLSIPETALALDISEATVKRDWAVAQAWLHRALRDTDQTNHE